MKQRFIDTKTQKQVNIGDDITVILRFFDDVFSFKRKIDADSIPALLEAGIIRAEKIEQNKKVKKNTPKVTESIHPIYKAENRFIPTEIASYINKIADRMNWNFEYTEDYLNDLLEINRAALFSVLLREIAVTLDEKYTDDISKSKDIYAVSVLNGKIGKVNTKSIKSFRTFAAFRSEDDTKVALYILNSLLKYMYKHEEKK